MACAAATAAATAGATSIPGGLDAASAVAGRDAPNMQSQLYSYCYSQASASSRDPPSPSSSPPPATPGASDASGEENTCASRR